VVIQCNEVYNRTMHVRMSIEYICVYPYVVL
jgi:hypothetical protein